MAISISVKTFDSFLKSERFTELKFDRASRFFYLMKLMLCFCMLLKEKE